MQPDIDAETSNLCGILSRATDRNLRDVTRASPETTGAAGKIEVPHTLETIIKPQFLDVIPFVVEGIVPAVRVFVFPRLLNPLEDLEEGPELDLTISQAGLLQRLFGALSATLGL